MASEISNKTKAIEKYVEETIIEYLKSQHDVPEYYNFDEINQLEQLDDAEEKQKTLFIIEELLNDILHDVDRTIIYRKHYNETREQHHQYPLFDLEDYVPGFHFDDHILRQLCFRETLLISNVDQPFVNGTDAVKPLAVGGLCLKIELAQGLPSSPDLTEKEMERNIMDTIKQLRKDLLAQTPSENQSDEEKLKKYAEFLEEATAKVPSKFVVHLSSEFEVDGQNAGSRIMSWVDQQFHTLEERRTEYIFENEKQSKSQTLYYALREHKYYVKHRYNSPEPGETRKYCPLSMTKDVIGEGANFILMRYLAISRYIGTFELSTFYINGSLCRNIYECKGPRPGVVNGHPVELCKIYRTIIEKSGIIHISVTVLTVYGMIVSQEWDGCPYIIHINPLFVTYGKPVPYDYIALKKVWETNMEFVSKYLDCKTEAEMKMKTYQKDHPEIHEMLSDYLQSVLLLKPENILPFTIDFFMSYEPYQLPQMPYFEEFNEKRDSSFW